MKKLIKHLKWSFQQKEVRVVFITDSILDVCQTCKYILGGLVWKEGSFSSTIYVQWGIATLSHCHTKTVLTVFVSHIWQTLIIIIIFLTYPTKTNVLQQIILSIKIWFFRFPWEFSRLFLAVFIRWGTSHMKNIFPAEKNGP